METVILVITILNTLMIILSALTASIIYFKKNYIIVDIETYQSMIEIVQEYSQMQEEQEPELVSDGGTGFFREYIEEEEEDDNQ